MVPLIFKVKILDYFQMLVPQEEEQWEQRIETFVQPARKMSSELSDKMKLELASFEAEAARAAAAERSVVSRNIEPDNTFREKLKVFTSIETEAATTAAPPPPVTAPRRDSESGGLQAAPPPLRRDSDTAWMQRAGRAESVTRRDDAPSSAGGVPAPETAARLPASNSFGQQPAAAAIRRDSAPASSEKLRDFPPFRSSSSSSALMNTIQNNKFFQQVREGYNM